MTPETSSSQGKKAQRNTIFQSNRNDLGFFGETHTFQPNWNNRSLEHVQDYNNGTIGTGGVDKCGPADYKEQWLSNTFLEAFYHNHCCLYSNLLLQTWPRSAGRKTLRRLLWGESRWSLKLVQSRSEHFWCRSLKLVQSRSAFPSFWRLSFHDSCSLINCHASLIHWKSSSCIIHNVVDL